MAVADASIAASPKRYRRIGHTGITWGYSADVAPNAIRDVGELGYRGFESFGSVLETWDARGGLQAQLEAQQLPLISAYCPLNLTDPAKRSIIQFVKKLAASILKQAVGQKTCASPVQPMRSFLCGQSVGTSRKFPRCPH